MSNQPSAEWWHKPIIRKFQKRKASSSFKDNIWVACSANMQLIIKSNKGFQFLLCVIGICSKYAWVVPLKDKNDITITNDLKKKLGESNRRLAKSKGSTLNQMCLDKGSEF